MTKYSDRLIRRATDENIDKIKKLNENFDLDNDVFALMDGILDMEYDDIRNGLILASDDLMSLFIGFSTDSKKQTYLAWMLNKYYAGTLEKELKKSIDEENYELSALINKVLNVVDMPSEKE